MLNNQIQTIFNFTKTDKASVHGYDEFYSKMFENYTPSSLLEIGVKRGSSMLAWSMIFPKCKLTGMDITDKEFIESNIVVSGAEILIQDSTKKGSEKAIKNHDVIIDDGSHFYKDILKTFKNYKNKFNKYYVIEDLMYKSEYIVESIKDLGFENVEIFDSKMKPVRTDEGWLSDNKHNGTFVYPQLKFVIVTK